MSRRPTINDIAAAAGVSVATVSKAVNGRYGVASATADRILAIVQEMGYESSLVASSMRGVRTGVIGVLVADFEPYSAEVLKGVGAAVHDSRYDVLAYSGARREDWHGWERRSLSRLSGSLIDGAIIVTPTVVTTSGDVPLVAIDPHTGPVEVPTVQADSHGGAHRATTYLVELGHRRIGFVAGRPDLRSSRERDAGYRRALADAGLAYDPSLVRVGHYDTGVSREQAMGLLQSDDRPTAVFAANDLSAIAILAVAAELGLSVPRDLSVIGFDDVPEASRFAPPLTTVRQPMRRLGASAVSMLLTLMAGGEVAQRDVYLPTQLVVRATTAPPRERG